jgi:hypothetical protein
MLRAAATVLLMKAKKSQKPVNTAFKHWYGANRQCLCITVHRNSVLSSVPMPMLDVQAYTTGHAQKGKSEHGIEGMELDQGITSL